MSALGVLAVLVAGLLLMVVEVVVIPGFGFAGLLSLGMLAFGAYAAWAAFGAVWGGLAALCSVVATGTIVLWLPRTRFGRRMVLQDAVTGHVGPPDHAALLGQQGETTTPLRPVGVARFADGERDVSAAAGHIDRGQAVRISHVDGTRIIVEAVGGADAVGDNGGGA